MNKGILVRLLAKSSLCPFVVIIIRDYTRWYLILKSVILRILESNSRVSQVLTFLKVIVVIVP